MSRKLISLAILVIGSVAFVAWQPALKIQFYDGWWYLEWAATLSFPRYLIQFLDPANITQGYRPVQGLYMLVLYLLFGFNPDGYHLAHTFLHAANSILLFAIVGRLGKRWRVALVAALVYAVSPVYSLAVFWHAVVDPLAGFFYLLTILFWTRFLETDRRIFWAAAFVAYLLALFSKEVSVFLPLILFLIERWFFGRKINLPVLVRRYAPFVIVWIPYLILVLSVQSHGEFVGQFGFSLGPHMIGNLMPYLAVLAFPWTTDLPNDSASYVWLTIAFIAYLGITIYKRSVILFFLALVAVLNISPLAGFPLAYFNTRYLYLSMMVSAIMIALLLDFGRRIFAVRRISIWVASALVGLLVIASGMRVAEAAADLAEYTRQIRVPFRDIARQHPTFANDTYLYFVYSPVAPVWDLKGLFFARYGTSVKVDSIDIGLVPEFRSHDAAFVYYFDPSGKPIELTVDKNTATHIAPALPARLAIPITLEGYDIPNARLKRGDALVITMNWRAASKLDQDYTIFAHLIDQEGRIVSEYDSQPRRGALPTSRWELDRLIVDAMVLPIAADAPLGEKFRLEVGMYDDATGKRVSIVNASAQVVGDKFVIEPFSIAQ